MILVNLLPSEFLREASRKGPSWLNRRVAKGLGLFFLLLTLLFYVQFLMSFKTLKGLESQWLSIQEGLRRVDQIRVQMETGSKGERAFLENYVLSPFRTTSLLNRVSQLLPGSLWLVELKVSRHPKENTLLLKGVALPSRDRSSVQEIEGYLRDLKATFPSQAELILTTSRQQKDRIELTLFTALFRWA